MTETSASAITAAKANARIARPPGNLHLTVLDIGRNHRADGAIRQDGERVPKRPIVATNQSTPYVNRRRVEAMDIRCTPLVLALSFVMAGCVGIGSDQGLDQASGQVGAADPASDADGTDTASAGAGAADRASDAGETDAGDARDPGWVPVERPVSVDLVVPFYVSYSQVAQAHCDSRILKLGGPIRHVNITATWDASDPLLPGYKEMSVYEGTAEGHRGWGSREPLERVRGGSPLTLAADVAANNTVLLEFCQWHVGVVEEFDVHVEGFLRYLSPTPEGAPTVYDMSGEFPPTSAGIGDTNGIFFDAGTVPFGQDENAPVLIDFQPELGPATLSVWICIGSVTVDFVFVDCAVWDSSAGEAVQLDATGLSGKTIIIGPIEGAGIGTTYVLCASVFDLHPPAYHYTAIVDGQCRNPAAAGE